MDFWQFSVRTHGSRSFRREPEGEKTLVVQGFHPRFPERSVAAIPKLDVAGSTPVARFTYYKVSGKYFGALSAVGNSDRIAELVHVDDERDHFGSRAHSHDAVNPRPQPREMWLRDPDG
jgi:hypothetical protein